VPEKLDGFGDGGACVLGVVVAWASMRRLGCAAVPACAVRFPDVQDVQREDPDGCVPSISSVPVMRRDARRQRATDQKQGPRPSGHRGTFEKETRAEPEGRGDRYGWLIAFHLSGFSSDLVHLPGRMEMEQHVRRCPGVPMVPETECLEVLQVQTKPSSGLGCAAIRRMPICRVDSCIAI